MLPPLSPCSAALARGNGRRERPLQRLSTGRNGVRDGRTQPAGDGLGRSRRGRFRQKDYFVVRDGVKFAGTHLLLDLWGASNLTIPS